MSYLSNIAKRSLKTRSTKCSYTHTHTYISNAIIIIVLWCRRFNIILVYCNTQKGHITTVLIDKLLSGLCNTIGQYIVTLQSSVSTVGDLRRILAKCLPSGSGPRIGGREKRDVNNAVRWTKSSGQYGEQSYQLLHYPFWDLHDCNVCIKQ